MKLELLETGREAHQEGEFSHKNKSLLDQGRNLLGFDLLRNSKGSKQNSKHLVLFLPFLLISFPNLNNPS